MPTRLVTAPAALPVTLAEVKAYCGVEHDADDALLLSFLAAAVGRCQDITGRQLVESMWDLFLDAFPAKEVRFPGAPLQSVESVSYVDTDGATQSLDAGTYVVDTVEVPGLVYPAYDQRWPETRNQRNAVVIRYTAGWPMSDDAVPVWTGPAEIQTWLKMRVHTLYEHRDALEQVSNMRLMAAIPRDFVDGLLDAYIVYGVGQ